jgi:hypothetical protein
MKSEADPPLCHRLTLHSDTQVRDTLVATPQTLILLGDIQVRDTLVAHHLCKGIALQTWRVHKQNLCSLSNIIVLQSHFLLFSGLLQQEVFT